jgi:hypothetical protein
MDKLMVVCVGVIIWAGIAGVVFVISKHPQRGYFDDREGCWLDHPIEIPHRSFVHCVIDPIKGPTIVIGDRGQ